MKDYLKEVEHSLFDYQHRDMNAVIDAFQKYDKVLFSGATSYGKTFSFSTVAKWFCKVKNQKVLILCHREELVEQCIKTCVKLGMTAQSILPKTKKADVNSDVYVAMEKTIYNRVKKNKYFLHNIGLIIMDEAHILYGIKHMDLFKGIKYMGFTGTPVLQGTNTFYKCDTCEREYTENTECCGYETYEWSRPRKMSDYYDTIVVGESVAGLIERGQIVPDKTYVIDTDLSDLKTDSSGEYTTKSMDSVFNKDEVVYNVVANYERICKGLRTMVFTSSTKNNVKVLEQFLSKGYNAKLYDSINSEENRKDVIKWFESESDAILISTNVFSVGFDSTDVQVIILNRATTSLSLFLQICGRACRRSYNIIKTDFICVDLGGNVDRFNRFSDSTRDWAKLFYKGNGKEKKKQEIITDVVECQNCGGLTKRSSLECEVCGDTRSKPKPKGVKEIDSIAKPIDVAPIPDAKKIIEYTKNNNQDLNFAFKVFTTQVVGLFRHHQVSKELYESTKRNGKFDARIDKMCRSFYFTAIRSDLPQRKNAKLATFIKKVSDKVAEMYN